MERVGVRPKQRPEDKHSCYGDVLPVQGTAGTKTEQDRAWGLWEMLWPASVAGVEGPWGRQEGADRARSGLHCGNATLAAESRTTGREVQRLLE